LSGKSAGGTLSARGHSTTKADVQFDNGTEAFPMKPKFLTAKFQVGSARSDKISYSLAQKVFHTGDVPEKVVLAKKEANQLKNPNILGTEPVAWNQSVISDPRIERGNPQAAADLKRVLLKVRAGLVDQPKVEGKGRSEEEYGDLCRYIVSVTGKGPIGKLTGKWFNAVDERGLHAHIDPRWQDWRGSASTFTKEAIKEKEAVFAEKEEQRKRMNVPSERLNAECYVDPTTGTANINMRLSEKKVEYQDLKEQFKQELKVEFPNASEERLQAMGQRLLNEKLLADEKLKRFPVQHESFAPNLALTSQDRRYKVFFHPGAWAYSKVEETYCWSCCMSFSQDSRGCERRVMNPDAWCTLGFDRGS